MKFDSKKEGIVVLSLFDGMSCGQIALKNLGIKVKEYYASEIDKYAIKVTQHNFPNTIQIGDVTKISAKDLPKIDLLIGGSPCQGFSFAGKQMGFNDPRSKLFFEFVRLKNECNPTYFLLENVKMKKESIAVISEYLGVIPIEINSALLSPQNRIRLYWTNITDNSCQLPKKNQYVIPLPKDKKIFLKDVLESNIPEKYYIKSEKMIKFVTDHWRLKKKMTQINGEKSLPLLSRTYIGWWGDYICDKEGKLRKLTPTECKKLQTIPDWYNMSVVSDRQQYKMLGNGWTVDVITHILSYMDLKNYQNYN
jgi:DNA-cytosine methyltransferase